MEESRQSLHALANNIASVFLGHQRAIKLTLTALLARGHLLVEDAPGVGKTLLARAVAQSLNLDFKRVQFTPDLLPSDITGVSIYDPSDRKFDFVPGPVFTNILLADEINRSSPRTQSSLLETMGEGQVSVDGVTRVLDKPFFVMATQNPIELQGTYPLPEAQLDRFLLCIDLGYPKAEDEAKILESHRLSEPIDELKAVMDADALMKCQEDSASIQVSPEMRDYIVAIANATRTHEGLRLGLSPRGSLALMKSAQAWAYLTGTSYVSPDDIKAVAKAVLGHRLIPDAKMEYSGGSMNDVITEIIDSVPIPTTSQELSS
ncbi:MAG: MoxR-like ATPase [Planctomycetota bacterium]|jgi:MoxR-like ATPase